MTGFRIWSGSLATSLTGIVVRTYLSGTLQESLASGQLGALISGSNANLYFTSTKPFNSIGIEVVSVVALLQQVRVFSFYTQTPSVLPVYLSDLRAEAAPGGARLSWQQWADEPVDYIEVERSGNGRDFRPLARVSGDSAGRRSFTDAGASDRCWYRVHALTAAGKSYYSPVATCRMASPGSRWRVAGVRTLQLNTDRKGNAVIRIYTSEGTLLWQERRLLQATQTVTLPAGAPGICLLVLEQDGYRDCARLLLP